MLSFKLNDTDCFASTKNKFRGGIIFLTVSQGQKGIRGGIILFVKENIPGKIIISNWY